MKRVPLCDRCGKEVDSEVMFETVRLFGYHTAYSRPGSYPFQEQHQLDICKPCMVDLKAKVDDWLRPPEEKP